MAENIKANYQAFTADAGVRFLQGTQTSLNALMTSQTAVEGAFYLTNDTHRLYVGRKCDANDATKVVPVAVNEGVTTVSAVNQLPDTANVGDFYYAESENILCVCSSVTGTGNARTCTWVQLNTDTQISKFSNEVSVSSNTATIASTVTTTNTAHPNYSDNWELVGSDNITLTVQNTGTAQAPHYKLSVAAKDTTYTLATAAGSDEYSASITLTDNAATPNVQTVNFTGTRIKLGRANDGSITLTGQQITGATATPENNGWSFGVKVDGLTVDTNTAVIDPIVAYGNNKTAHFVTTSGANAVTGTATLDIYDKDQVDDLIESAITDGLQGLDAMRFMGTVASASDINTAISDGLHNGDTFKVTNNFTYSNQTVTVNGDRALKTGDIIIAKGTEDSDGEITANSLELYFIPSGDEYVYVGDFTNGDGTSNIIAGVSIIERTTAGTDRGRIAGFKLVSGNDNLITIQAPSSVSNNISTITLKHSTVSRSNTVDSVGAVQSHSFNSSGVATALEFYVPDYSGAEPTAANADSIMGITTDGYGHITNVALKKITVQDTHNYIKAYKTNRSDATSTANGITTSTTTVTHTLEHADANIADAVGTVKYQSTTLSTTSSVANNQATVNLEIKWGSF